MKEFNKYVGLDVHKESISVTVADKGRSKPRYFGEITNRAESIRKLVSQLSTDGEEMSFCYEAGPCGYAVYRQLMDLGQDCQVVAPSLIPKKAGDRIKTDKRDGDNLSRLHRAGELTSVWVPDQHQESMRDLVRSRDDFKQMEKKSRQHLNAFVLRQGLRYEGKSKWTQAHWRWLEKLSFEQPMHHVVLQEYIDAVGHHSQRVKALESQMAQSLEHWCLAPVVRSLMAMRGIDLVTAMGIVAELGDISRFERASQLMSYLGLVPSEHSSGNSQHRGPITKTGNKHVRRLLVESAWCYRFAARKSDRIQRRAEHCSEEVQAIAWKAQQRLCARYRHLQKRTLMPVKIVTAIARELCGFIWAIACEAMKSVTLKPAIRT